MATIAVFSKGPGKRERLNLKEFVEVELPKRFGGSKENGYKWWDYIGLFCIGALMRHGGVLLTEHAFNKHAERVGLEASTQEKMKKLLIEDHRVEVYA